MLSNDDAITALRVEAIKACDVPQIYLCDLALSAPGEDVDVEDYALDHDEQRELARYTRASARLVCIEAIRAARCNDSC